MGEKNRRTINEHQGGRTIGRKLLIRIILVSGFMTFVFTAYQIYFDYRSDLDDLNASLKAADISHSQAIANSVWEFNDNQLQLQLDGLSKQPGIARVTLRYGENLSRTITRGKEVQDKSISKSFSLTKQVGGRKLNIGELVIIADFPSIKTKLMDRISTVLVYQGIKTFIISLFILYIVNYLIVQHVVRISNWLHEFRPDAPFVPLGRNEHAGRDPDEIDALMNKVNEMGETVHMHSQNLEALVARRTQELEESRQELIRHRDNLEELVEERTAEVKQQAEEALQHAQKMEAVGQLTSGISHDFNNLLHIMIGNTEILEAGIGEDKAALRQVNAIKRAVERASSLTNRLLSYSRKQDHTPVTLAITGLINGLDDMLRRTLGETVQVTTELAPDLWSVTIDPHQFENALVNLAINARDAMPKGGTLTIATANVTLDETYAKQHEDGAPGDFVKISVTDTGTGMTPEVLNQVLQPFFTTKAVGEGSGLGLSMVHSYVKQFNGHLTIHSEVGHGTSVNLYLPRSGKDVTRSAAKAGISEFEQGTERILVVEDDEHVRKIPVTILKNQGYDVVEAKDGKDAIDHLQNGQPFDLVFTDVVLPGGMNGVELVEEAKRIQPDIKVLYTSGYSENAILHDGHLAAGATLVSKPYPRAELLQKIQSMLEI